MKAYGLAFLLLGLPASCCGTSPDPMALKVQPGSKDLLLVAVGGLIDPDRDDPPRVGYTPADGTEDAFVQVRPQRDGLSVLGQALTKDTVYLLDFRGLNTASCEVRLFRPVGSEWEEIESQVVADGDRVGASYQKLAVIVQADSADAMAMWLFVHAGAPWNDVNGVRLHIESSLPL